jgi:hypothetical protein
MIAVHVDMLDVPFLFGTSAGCSPGVDLILQSDGEEHYAFITREAWMHVSAHLVETNLYPEWSYARQITMFSAVSTMHKPRDLIVSQDRGLRGVMGLRVRLARRLKWPIYTALELTDGSTVWEQWS